MTTRWWQSQSQSPVLPYNLSSLVCHSHLRSLQFYLHLPSLLFYLLLLLPLLLAACRRYLRWIQAWWLLLTFPVCCRGRHLLSN